MTKKNESLAFVRRPLPRPKKLTVFTGLTCCVATGVLTLCVMSDVHLAGGYDFMGKTIEARVLVKLLPAAATLVALKLVALSFARPRILEVTLGVVVFGLMAHVPITFGFIEGVLGWSIVVVAALAFVAFMLSGTSRVREDLLRCGPNPQLANL